MGLNMLGTNGMVITETKTWILRCYGCFKTTPIMEKKFCPKCGNKTLKRVSVTLNRYNTLKLIELSAGLREVSQYLVFSQLRTYEGTKPNGHQNTKNSR